VWLQWLGHRLGAGAGFPICKPAALGKLHVFVLQFSLSVKWELTIVLASRACFKLKMSVDLKNLTRCLVNPKMICPKMQINVKTLLFFALRG
jgi:hypothetical protein